MRNFLKYLLIVNPKYNIFYFTFCFGIYYIIGYLYIIHNPLLMKVAKFFKGYFSPVISVIPRFRKMFGYLSSVQHSDVIGVISFAIVIMIILILLTFIQIIFLKNETYEVGHGSFFKKIERWGWKAFIMIMSLFITLYLIWLLLYFPNNYIFPYLQYKNITHSPFVLMLEIATHHFFISCIGLFLYVVPFIYIPYRNRHKTAGRSHTYIDVAKP